MIPTQRKKIKQVSSSVATVMPEMGLELEPISPVKREETVTNRNPNRTIKTAHEIHVGWGTQESNYAKAK